MQFLKKITLKNVLMLTLAGLINAAGITLFLAPVRLYDSGISGTAMFLALITPKYLTLSVFLLILNVPLFLFGLKKQGPLFTVYAIYSVAMYSLFAWLITSVLPLDVTSASPLAGTDLLLCAVFGGIISGVGIGLVFLAGASTGGSDIVAKLLRRRFRTLPLGRLMLVVDLIVISLTGIVYHDISKALYSAVPLYVTSVVMDGLIYGLDYSTVALIISDAYEPIVQAIEQKLDRGVTMLDGHGGYSGAPKQVLLCAIRRKQVPQLKDLVREIDPNAFVILQEAHQVLGEGFRRHGDEM